MVVISAAVVFPGISRVTSGLQLSWPSDPKMYVILPWVGTILAGSMGIVWFGYWTATRGYGGGLAGSVLANQDGWGRSFADMTLILLRSGRHSASPGVIIRGIRALEHRYGCRLFTRLALKRFYIALVTGIVPAIILVIFKDPVKVMSASGIIAAAVIKAGSSFIAVPRAVTEGVEVKQRNQHQGEQGGNKNTACQGQAQWFE